MLKSHHFLMLCFCLMTIPTCQAQHWMKDFANAKKIAQKDHKKIILVFQGSDWCAPCIKLNREIWTTNEFIDYADKHYVLVLADFPRRSKNRLPKEQQDKNKKLAEQYNQEGYFPLVVILNPQGEVLGKTGYLQNTSPAKYIDNLNSFE